MIQTMPDPPRTTVADVGRAFFVTVLDNGRHGFLAGPYATFGEAEDAKPAAVKKANEADPRAAWYAFGVSQAPDSTNPVFGRL